jgi:hypothetical protein
MGAIQNGEERTVGAFVALVDGTGWKISEIIQGHALSSVILVPV